jgi:hypothetical protein
MKFYILTHGFLSDRLRGGIAIFFQVVLLMLITAGCARKQSVAQLPEQLVYVQSSDDVPNCGICFSPSGEGVRSVAVIWVHGWGVNFSQCDQ